MTFTPTQQIVADLLADGLPHSRDEIALAIDPGFTSREVVRFHVSRVRRKLRPKGEDIVCCLVHRKICYQHVRLLSNPYNGNR